MSVTVSSVESVSQVASSLVANVQSGATAKDFVQAVQEGGGQNTANAIASSIQLATAVAEFVGKSFPESGLIVAAGSLVNNLQQIGQQVEANQPISQALVLQASSDLAAIAGGVHLLRGQVHLHLLRGQVLH